MKWQELAPSLERSELAPLYLIVGEEDFLRDQAVSTIKQALFGDGDSAGFNCDLFYGDECRASDIVTCAQEVPAFAARRLVIVKGMEKFPTRDAEELIPYLRGPCESTSLVLSAAKLDGRLKVTQVLKDRAVTVDCSPLPANQMAGWIRAQASQAGVKLDDEAIQSLSEMGGQSLYLIRQELQKLAAAVSERAAGAADVERVRGTEPGVSVFDLSAAIASGDHSRALRVVTRTLETGEAPLRILGALVWQYRRLWKAHALVQERRPDAEVGRALGVPPFRLKDFLVQVRRLSESHFRSAFHLFLQADNAMKGGSATAPQRMIEWVVFQLCAWGREASRGRAGEGEVKTDRPSPPAKQKTRPIQTVRTIRSGLKPSP